MAEWQSKAVTLYNKYGNSWTKIASELSAELGETFTLDRVRHYLRYGQFENKPENPTKKPEPQDLLKLLQKEHTLDELADKSGLSVRVVQAQIEDLKETGFNISDFDGKYQISKVTNQEENVHNHDWKGERELTFGLVSDQHLSSKACQLTHLHDFYDRCAEYGVKDIYGCGDLVDGMGVYPGQEFGLHNYGMDEQLRFFIKNYPQRKDITTHSITGNHCLKTFAKTGNDIGRAIANERKDINYLGQYYARVNLTPKCILQLCHPMGNLAYSLTYKLQRKLDGMTGGDKPAIVAEGHFHSGGYIYRRNIHGLMLPSFQGPNDLSRRLGLESNIGGIIVTVKLEEDGTIKEFTPKFINYMKLIDEDYKNFI